MGLTREAPPGLGNSDGLTVAGLISLGPTTGAVLFETKRVEVEVEFELVELLVPVGVAEPELPVPVAVLEPPVTPIVVSN